MFHHQCNLFHFETYDTSVQNRKTFHLLPSCFHMIVRICNLLLRPPDDEPLDDVALLQLIGECNFL